MSAQLTAQEVKGVFEKISNWGKWGKEDELGALNYITPQKRAAAARLAQRGADRLAGVAAGDAIEPGESAAGPAHHAACGTAGSRGARFLLDRPAWDGVHASGRALPRLLARQDV